MKIKEKMAHLRLRIYATASDTCFAKSTVGSVVIVEPPHRGDMPKVPFHELAKRIFQFLKTPTVAFEFYEAWKKLIGEYTLHQQKFLEINR